LETNCLAPDILKTAGGRLRVRRLGRVTYAGALELQERLSAAKRRDRDTPDYLLMMEFDPVVTVGRGGGPEQLLADPEEMRRQGVDLVFSERGGGAAYHGPGQITVFPILDIKRDRDLHAYLRRLESVIIETLAEFGLRAHTVKGLTGVWVGRNKIGAIGIGVRNWVTGHGFAVNIDPDLSRYRLINQCGLADKGVTSLKKELGAVPETGEFADALAGNFSRVFGYGTYSTPEAR
jgi:lipoate-protein ligase B